MDLKKVFDKPYLLALTVNWLDTLKLCPIKIANPTISTQNPSKTLYILQDTQTICQINMRKRQIFVAFCIQIVQLFYLQKNAPTAQHHATIDSVIAVFALTGMIYSAINIHLSRNNGNLFAMYLNNLLRFEARYQQTYKRPTTISTFSISSHLERFNILLALILLILPVLFPPLFILGFHWANPCKASLTGFFILSDCCTTYALTFPNFLLQAFINRVAKTAIFLGNIWIWFNMLGGAMSLTILIQIVGAMMSQECVRIFYKQLKSSKNIYKATLVYRQLYILNEISNIILQYCMAIFICTLITEFSIVLSTLITLSNGNYEESNWLIIASIVIMCYGGLLCMLALLGGLVSVFKESREVLSSSKLLETRYECRKDRKWARRYWKSCSVFKMKFGDNNFLEDLTPLKCLDFSFDLTIQFWLLSANK